MSKTPLSELAKTIHEALKLVIVGGTYRHLKSGDLYRVALLEFREADMCLHVSYRPIEDETALVVFSRPMTEFLAGYHPVEYRWVPRD